MHVISWGVLWRYLGVKRSPLFTNGISPLEVMVAIKWEEGFPFIPYLWYSDIILEELQKSCRVKWHVYGKCTKISLFHVSFKGPLQYFAAEVYRLRSLCSMANSQNKYNFIVDAG